jgi:hypothetical protein
VPLAEDLLEHSRELLNGSPKEVELRRSVSAAYYAIFHLLSAAVAGQVSPDTPPGLRGRTQRALDHSSMVNAAKQFRKQGGPPSAIPRDIDLKSPTSQELANVADAFVVLQEARYLGDYDILDANRQISLRWAQDCVEKAENAFRDWRKEMNSEGARVFLASLILGQRRNKG